MYTGHSPGARLGMRRCSRPDRTGAWPCPAALPTSLRPKFASCPPAGPQRAAAAHLAMVSLMPAAVMMPGPKLAPWMGVEERAVAKRGVGKEAKGLEQMGRGRAPPALQAASRRQAMGPGHCEGPRGASATGRVSLAPRGVYAARGASCAPPPAHQDALQQHGGRGDGERRLQALGDGQRQRDRHAARHQRAREACGEGSAARRRGRAGAGRHCQRERAAVRGTGLTTATNACGRGCARANPNAPELFPRALVAAANAVFNRPRVVLKSRASPTNIPHGNRIRPPRFSRWP